MLVYVTPIVTLLGTLLFVGMTCSKDEKVRDICRVGLKIVGGVIGVFLLVQVIGLVSAFIELNF